MFVFSASASAVHFAGPGMKPSPHLRTMGSPRREGQLSCRRWGSQHLPAMRVTSGRTGPCSWKALWAMCGGISTFICGFFLPSQWHLPPSVQFLWSNPSILLLCLTADFARCSEVVALSAQSPALPVPLLSVIPCASRRCFSKQRHFPH